MKINTELIPEFLGQIIDIFEDFLEEMERVIKSEFDYVTFLIEFPDEIRTEEEAEEFFDDHYRMTYM